MKTHLRGKSIVSRECFQCLAENPAGRLPVPSLDMNTSMDHVASAIRIYIAQNILFSGDRYPYPDDASFLDEGIVDSMNLLELVTFVEGEFGIKVIDIDIVPANFDSVSSLAAYVRKRQAA